MRALVFTALIALVIPLTHPGVAEAGFGRRGSSSNNNNNNNNSRSSGGGSHTHHDDTPPAWSSGSNGGFGRNGSYRNRGDGERSRWGRGYYRPWGFGLGYMPPTLLLAPSDSPEPYDSQLVSPPLPAASSAASVDLLVGSGAAIGAQIFIEGRRLGFEAGYTGLSLPVAGSNRDDVVHLGRAHLTYAFIATSNARVRAEIGAHLASAPEVLFLAPGAGISAAVGIVGPLGVEARVFGNAWPYTQVDARLGLTLAFGRLGISSGIRSLYLNDNGVLGAVNAGDTSDHIVGPYFNLAFAL